jgi:signal transduction histidine kinase
VDVAPARASRSDPAGTPLRSRWSPNDIRLAVVVGAVQLAGTVLAVHHRAQPGRRPLDALGVVLLLAGPAALALRRRFPVAVLEVAFLSTLAYVVIGYRLGPIWLGLIVAYVYAAWRGRRWAAWGTLAVGWAAFLWLPHWFGRDRAPFGQEILGLAAWLLVLAAVAEVVKVRRERAVERERMRREEAERRAGEERLRIAQELHDVLAHNISLISVQAGVGLHLIDEHPDQARAALAAIKDASREALGELRSVLDVLRREGDAAPLVPAPRLAADLDGLVAKAASAGVAVRVEVSGGERPLPPAGDRAAFRIAQEALTNVARHAGGAGATVLIGYGDEALTLQVDDDGPGGAPSSDGSGRGLTGMRERAVALGGRLDAGPRPGGGFRVRAWLPLDAVSRSAEGTGR